MITTNIRNVAHQRYIGLDILRIFFAFLVFVFHSRIHLNCDYGVFNDFISAGKIAMSGFFMLSGFSLQLAYGKRELSSATSIISFYKKRIISIYPLYIIVGTLYVMMSISVGKQTLIDNLLLLPIELLGMQSMFSESLFEYAHNSGTWFVSCLLLGYLLYPLLKNILTNRSVINNLYIIIASVLLLCYCQYIAFRFHTIGLYTNPIFRLIEFVLGICLFQISESLNIRIKLSIKRFGGIISICVLFFMIVGVSLLHQIDYFRDLIVIPSFGLLIIICANMNNFTSHNKKTIKYMSEITYAFFLAQFLIWQPLRYTLKITHSNIDNYILIFGSLGVCILISILLHELIEKKVKSKVRL